MSTRPITQDDLWSIPVASDPQITPDGSSIAYIVTAPDRETDDYRSQIWTVPTSAADQRPRQLTHGARDSAPRWSPDGRRLAFIRADDNGVAQIFVMPADMGDPEQVTRLTMGAGVPVWSPDGTRLAFSAAVDLDPPPAGKDQRPVVARSLEYKVDGPGLIKSARSHLFVADLGRGDVSQLTFGDISVSLPVWSPDGTRLAFSTSTDEDRDLEVVRVVHVIDVSGGRPVPVTPAGGLFSVAAWSPDAEALLLHGQERLHAGHDHLYRVGADGGPIARLSPGYDRNVMPGGPGYPGAVPRYYAGGSLVAYCARERGAVVVMSVPAAGGTPSELVGGDRVVGGLSISADGRMAFVAADATSSGEVWVRDPDGSERQLTDLFRSALPDVELVAPRSESFRAPDGTEVHGWVLRLDDLAGPGPLLLDVHGGPHNAWGPVFDGAHLYHQSLVAAGWTVLIINPRGSDGYGEAFWNGVVGGWGKSDEGDFLAAVDDLIRRGWADPDRLAVSGYSYGGFMACWLTGRTGRFAAAVAGGCVSDLVSLGGTSDLGRHLMRVEIESTVRDGLDSLLDLSPVTRAESVRTPTLILHGEQDNRCPVGQAEEWFAVLRDQQVPVEMVRYPGASHLFILSGRPSQRIDYGRRVESWVRTHTDAARRGRVRRRPLLGGDLHQRLETMIARHGVPGASLAVLRDGEVCTAAAGVLNLATGVETTPDSLFQIGSITKTYTATIVMQLVEEGRLDLDAPVLDVLPELQLLDLEVTKAVTMRHLLSHTSGIEGDHIRDDGRGDDCLARYVATCADLGQSNPLGTTMSYCNSGYVIAGHVIEVLTDQVWDQALAERLLRPLGLTHTVTLPEDAIRFRTATGHAAPGDGPLEPVPVWGLPRSSGPAGLICATASDVIGFARMHLEGGGSVLPEPRTRAMREPQVVMPDPFTLGTHWGLGWILFEWNKFVFGHDGNTLGQSAFLRVVPDEGVAIALLTNGGHPPDLYRELYGGLLDELAGVVMPPRPAPPTVPLEPSLDLDVHTGVYERVGARIEVANRGGRLVATATVTGPLAALTPNPVTVRALVAVDQDLFVTRQPGEQAWTPMVFYRLPDGAQYMHFGVRATPKVA